MVVEKVVGDSEAIEMTIRPGLSETTSNATLPVTTHQSVNTVLQVGRVGVLADAQAQTEPEVNPGPPGVYTIHGRGLYEV